MGAEATYTVFSARAEMEKDIFGVVHAMNAWTYKTSAATGDKNHERTPGLVKTNVDLTFLKPGFYCGEAYVEFHFNLPVTLEHVRACIRSVGDIPELVERGIEPHVLMQTLRPVPAAENSMERNFEIE